MNRYSGAEKRQGVKAALRAAVYLLAVLFVCVIVARLCAVDPSIADTSIGTVDLTAVDFTQGTVTVDTLSYHIYPGAFYLPEDFHNGTAPAETVSYGTGTPIGEYGTARVEVKLPPGEVYAISAKNMSFAQRLFIDGAEYPAIGTVGDRLEAVTPKTTRYFAAFQPTGETTEIVMQYAAFVYGDGGGMYAMELGLAEDVARSGQLRAIRVMAVTAGLIVAALFLLGLFLHFPGSRYLLWFALCCVCIALRGLFVGDKIIMTVLPDLGWYLSIRLEFLFVLGIALFSGLYLHSLFPVIRRWIIYAYSGFCAAAMLLVCLTPPVWFSRFTGVLSMGSALFLAGMLVWVVFTALRGKLVSPLSGAERRLILMGGVFYVTMLLVETRAHPAGWTLAGVDFDQVGMVVFLFVNVLALVLGFARAQRERDEAKQAEREMQQTNAMLEHMNRLKSEFLGNISHELKTPLTVISGYAQLTDQQIADGHVQEDTQENLRVISREALRLSALADGLLRVSAEKEFQLKRKPHTLQDLFGRTAAVCHPILAKHGNRLSINAPDDLPVVQINENAVQQALLNLIINANRQMADGTVAIAARERSGVVVVTVSDEGSGIDSALLPHVFERTVSGTGGSGYGLFICKQIVEEHGGDIFIDSAPGLGARVTFTLPVSNERRSTDGQDHSDD